MRLDRCSWKLVASDQFVLGMEADRCGEEADVQVLRPKRKTDLFLCEDHLNQFILRWSLNYELRIL